MCWWKESFLSKKNPRYYYVFFGLSKASPADPRYSRGGLTFFVDFEKWKTSDLSCLISRPNWLNRNETML